MATTVGILCFVLGLYAGKKRAKGLGWGEIGKDFCYDAYDLASRALATVSAPFRKEPAPQARTSDAPNE